jgi:hypothetical protein
VLTSRHVRIGGLLLKFDKVEVSGIVVLFVGVILLVATFYSAFMFLVGDITILTSADLAELFGNALSPLIAAVIHVLYLGVMGWMGSVMTIRAVQLVKKEKDATPIQSLPKANASPTPTQAPAKNEPQKENKETRNHESPQKAPAPVPQPPAAPQQEPKEKAPEKPLEPVVAT